ncbi:MAG TPA: hypothetical protein VD886_22450 [Herpetosiphonaceae bacterium]|nr:hypothetical protein [Herpetosiphonaceae bacterium]
MIRHLFERQPGRGRRAIWTALLGAAALLVLGVAVIVANRPGDALAATHATGFDSGKLDAGAPGSTRTYTHTLKNDSGLPQTFNLTAASSKGFTVSVTPPSVAIASGHSAPVSVQVTIPAGTKPGVLDVTTLTAANIAPAPPLVVRIKDTTLADAGADLKVPEQQTGQLSGDTRAYSLTAAPGETEFWPGVQTPTYGTAATLGRRWS